MNNIPDHAYSPASPRLPAQPQAQLARRDYFAGQALANAAICTGVAAEYELRTWFGDRCGITRYEIVAKQALKYADAMLDILTSEKSN